MTSSAPHRGSAAPGAKASSAIRCLLFVTAFVSLLLSACANRQSPRTGGNGAVRVFQVRGVIKNLPPDGLSASIRHEAIPGYMAAMTMPFRVKDARELSGV